MKHLILLRHAEADPGGSDFERKLTLRGLREAEEASAAIRKILKKLTVPPPRLILSSPARRALQTIVPFSGTAAGEAEIRTPRELYLPGVESCLEQLWAAGEEESVLLCSHNPGISLLGEALFRWIGLLSPGGFIIGGFTAESWTGILPGEGTLLYGRPVL